MASLDADRLSATHVGEVSSGGGEVRGEVDLVVEVDVRICRVRGRGEGERHAGREGALGGSVCATGGELPSEPDPPRRGGINRREGDVDREMV